MRFTAKNTFGHIVYLVVSDKGVVMTNSKQELLPLHKSFEDAALLTFKLEDLAAVSATNTRFLKLLNESGHLKWSVLT